MSADEYGFRYPPGEKPHEVVLANYAVVEIYGYAVLTDVCVEMGCVIVYQWE